MSLTLKKRNTSIVLSCKIQFNCFWFIVIYNSGVHVESILFLKLKNICLNSEHHTSPTLISQIALLIRNVPRWIEGTFTIYVIESHIDTEYLLNKQGLLHEASRVIGTVHLTELFIHLHCLGIGMCTLSLIHQDQPCGTQNVKKNKSINLVIKQH